MIPHNNWVTKTLLFLPYIETTGGFDNNVYFVKTEVAYAYDSRGNVATSATNGITDSFTYDDKPNSSRAFDFLPDAEYGNSNNVTSDIALDFNGNVYYYLKSTCTYESNGNVIQKQNEQYNGKVFLFNYTFLCH